MIFFIQRKICMPVAVFLLFILLSAIALADNPEKIKELERRIQGLKPNPDFKDDVYGIIVIKQALTSLKEGSGGIGACLVNEKSGRVVAVGRNRQYTPYFRSDLHAEMDLLTRWEDWQRKNLRGSSGSDPRKCEYLVLISSVEPCPMCLTRIINSGIKKMYYVVPDERGGMVSKMGQLPPFWRELAQQRDYRQAVCSPEIQQIAGELFNFSMRVWSKRQKE